MTSGIDFAAARARAEELIAEAPRRQPPSRYRCKGAREVLGMYPGLPGGDGALYEPLRRDLERVSRAAGVSREELLALAAAGRPWPKVERRAPSRELDLAALRRSLACIALPVRVKYDRLESGNLQAQLVGADRMLLATFGAMALDPGEPETDAYAEAVASILNATRRLITAAARGRAVSS